MDDFDYFYCPDELPGIIHGNNADPFFALVIPPGFYLHLVEVADQDSASGSL